MYSVNVLTIRSSWCWTLFEVSASDVDDMAVSLSERTTTRLDVRQWQNCTYGRYSERPQLRDKCDGRFDVAVTKPSCRGGLPPLPVKVPRSSDSGSRRRQQL